MTELRECPFCGASDSLRFLSMLGGGIHMIDCFNCGAMVSFCKPGEDEPSREQATERWNSRYEPTCKVHQSGYATGFCGHCGAEFMASVVNNQPPDYVESAHHCPNCGRRVVEVDE